MTYLDGGMGTQLQERGLKAGETPEDWNVERPDDVASVHQAYAAAGSDIVYANTFGANPLKYHGRYALADVVRGAFAAARKAGVKVALDIGPTGKLLKPAGDLGFAAAVDAFAELVKLGAPLADLVVIETMGDLRELKAAVVAAKENCSLPVYATVSLDETGKLLTGGSVEAFATLMESLGVDAYGFNCGLGPDRMLPFVERLAAVSTKPIIVKPNAGMPRLVDGKTVFGVGPEEFAGHVASLIRAGASIVGGCCGTTPGHIGRCLDIGVFGCLDSTQPPNLPNPNTQTPKHPNTFSIVSSGVTTVTLVPHQGLVIGERINPTGKKLLKEAYKRGDTAYVLREAVKQIDQGAEILDVNCGVPGIDEAATLAATVEAVQSVTTVPLQIDTADPKALEIGLRLVNGKALVNSVNGKRESMDAVFPLVKKYGGVIVALCLDESGIPATSDGRLAIAKRILEEGAKYGFTKNDFVFDALTLAVSADPNAAIVTLETVKRLTDELGVNTVLGVSNVSFGLPNRPALNNAMYTLAKRAGLSAAIANPSLIRECDDAAAFDVLLGKDANCAKWIAANQVDAAGASSQSSPSSQSSSSGPAATSATDLADAIRRGLQQDARAAAEAALAAGKAPMELIQSGIVPALEEVGRGFEKGTLFLPQLLMAADAAGEAFAVVRSSLSRSSDNSNPSTSQLPNSPTPQHPDTALPPIVIATVKGDIHDIGKNIVRALLENYGFDVIDLGRDVAPEAIVEAAKKSGAFLVGLSALMTTTVGAMAETIRQLKSAGLGCKTCVGGAVVTEEYAKEIGADFYAKDAMRTVRIAESLRDSRI